MRADWYARLMRSLPLAGVSVGAGVSAVVLWLRYGPLWRHLWIDVIHDRNAHLDFGLGGASDLVHLRWFELLRDVNWYRTWPPLHDGVMVGLTMLASGLDPRFAVIPSLLAYAMTAVLAHLLARRLVDHGGDLAGAVAATFVLVSPAGRAFATDVMIESAGGAATLLTLWSAVRVRQGGTDRDWRALALSLSVIFFTKYNYWALVVVPVAADLWRAGLLTRPRLTTLLRWHLLPAAVWLAIPGKFERFLWVLWPGTNAGEFPAGDRLGGFAYYAAAAARDYHVGVWAGVVAAALVMLALLAWGRGRLRAGAGVLMATLAIAIAVTAPHQNRKSRFLHSWIPLVWVLGGAGVAASAARARGAAALLAGGLTIGLQLPGVVAAPHAPEAGVRADQPSALELTDAFLPYLADARRPAVLSNMPLLFLARWTYLDRYGRGDRVVTAPEGFDDAHDTADNARVFKTWLASGEVDTVVYVHLPRGSPWHQAVPGTEGLGQFEGLLRDAHLAVVFDETLPMRGGARVTVFRVPAS